MTDGFAADWRDRLASGSKLAAKALAQALRDDPARVGLVAPLTADPHVHVRVNAMRALAEAAHARPESVAPYAREIVEGLAAPEPDLQACALDALASVSHLAPEEVALALPLIADLLRAKRPALREEAAKCLGRLGAEVPDRAPAAARALADALPQAKGPRGAHEAREILAALEGVVPNLPLPERDALAPRVQSLRGHPNIQVRERAGRLARVLGG